MGFRLFDKISIGVDDQIVQTRSYAYALLNTAQSIAGTGQPITLIYNVEHQDNLGEYDPTTGIFTSQKGGIYLVAWTSLPASHTWGPGDQFTSSLFINDTDAIGSRYIGYRNESFVSYTGFAQSNFATIVKINPNDNMRIKAVNVGSTVTMYAGGIHNHLTIIGVA